ncbi:MAG: hypothetical protein WD898_02650, partial [Candidatus Paceibacterota bacterium]
NRVIIVHLRKPRRNDPNEMRKDPFWEFGSFGLTGCHKMNIMHPKNADKLVGARLAFAQGGHLGMKLVFLTPPVEMVRHGHRVEARWNYSMPDDHDYMRPFQYIHAPLLINNRGKTDFPSLRAVVAGVSRQTWVAKFSSKYRGCRESLKPNVAREVERVFDRSYQHARITLARSYADVLPYPPPRVDLNRVSTYVELLNTV